MAESDIHWQATAYARHSMDMHFAERKHEVYVASDNFFYWEKGNPRAVVSPDVYVVFGVPGHLRDCYKMWEENEAAPSFVLEITSRSTRRTDMADKFDTYEATLRVPEYFLFDPTRDYISTRLSGFRLAGHEYLAIQDNARGYLPSEELGLEFLVQGSELRIFNPQTGTIFPTVEELERTARLEAQRANEEAQRANVEAQRAETFEAEIARLRAYIAATVPS